jgi:hypothetical protein
MPVETIPVKIERAKRPERGWIFNANQMMLARG